MNRYMNDTPDLKSHAVWHFHHQIQKPGPSEAIVFVDEHQNSIENARFVINQPGVWIWTDFPATRHLNGATLSFADGHAETVRWTESTTIETGKRSGYIQGVRTRAGDRDLTRIQRGIPVVPIDF